jgi:hypothetical protein
MLLMLGMTILAISMYSAFFGKHKDERTSNNFPLFTAIIGFILSVAGLNLIIIFWATT